MKKILMLVLALLLFCLPAFAAKDAKKGPMPAVATHQVQIVQYPVVPCALSIPSDWVADIDDNNVMFVSGGESAIMVWAQPKEMPFDSLAQLTDTGKSSFIKQMTREAGEDKKDFKVEKSQLITINNRTAFDLECSYLDPDTNKTVFNHNIYVIKAKKLLIISGFCPYVLADISNLNKLMDGAGF